MDDIELKRGQHSVTLKKVGNQFAVRLKSGRAITTDALEATCGRHAGGPLSHVDSAFPENLEVFAIQESGELEATMQQLRNAPASDVVSHTYSLEDGADGTVIPTGNMTIQFAEGASLARREEILESYGLEIVRDLDYLPDGFAVRLGHTGTPHCS